MKHMIFVIGIFFCSAVTGQNLPRNPQDVIPIISQNIEHAPDGGYRWSYETGNGIKAEETGNLKQTKDPENPVVVVAQGGYSYTAPDGSVIQLSYVADDEDIYRLVQMSNPQRDILQNFAQMLAFGISTHAFAVSGKHTWLACLTFARKVAEVKHLSNLLYPYQVGDISKAFGGFQPAGAHLPTPPPIPLAIQRALDFIASQPSTQTPGGGFGKRK